MFGLIRSLPYIAVVAALAYGAHWFIVNQLENEIVDLRNDLKQIQMENIALQTAAQTCEQTVQSLEEQITKQQADISELQTSNQTITQERDSYLSVFSKRGRNFTLNARRKPGLIEPIINNGTQEVFDSIEQDTQHESTIPDTDSDNP
jgi:myosin heavy subunit